MDSKAVDCLKETKVELEARVARGKSALLEEKYELVCMGNSPYYALGVLSYVHKYGAIFVAVRVLPLTFSNPMIPLDLDKPLETLARKYSSYYLNLSFDRQVEWQDYFTKECKVDGNLYLTQRGYKILPRLQEAAGAFQ